VRGSKTHSTRPAGRTAFSAQDPPHTSPTEGRREPRRDHYGAL